MPYPYPIVPVDTASLFSDSRQAGTPGVHYHSGYLFQALARASNPSYLDMYASNVASGDPGSTWNLQDSGNSKRLPQASVHTFRGRGEARSGAILYYVIGEWDVPNRLKVVRFDMATRTWLSDIPTGPDNAYYFDGVFYEAAFKIVVLSNGNLFIVYKTTKTIGAGQWAQMNGVIYNVTTPSWGAPFIILEPSTTEDVTRSYHPHFLVLGSSDRIHIIAYAYNGGFPQVLVHRTWTSGTLNAIRIELFGPQPRPDSINATNGILYTFCGTTWVCLAYADEFNDTQNNNVNTRRLTCVFFPDENAPTNWRRDTFYQIDDEPGTPWHGASLATDGTTLYFVYSDFDVTATPDKWALRYFCLKQTRWAGPTDVVAMSVNDVVDVCANFVNGKLGISFMGYEGGAAYENPHYFELTPTCNALSCAGGGGAAPKNFAYLGAG